MLTSDWSNHALLFVAYLYGFIFAATPALGAAIDAQWTSTLLVALASTAMLGAGTWANVVPSNLPPPYSWKYLLFWSLYAIGAWAWVVTALGIGRRWLRREGVELRYGREIGYDWYVLHQPVIVAAAYWIVTWRVGLPEQFVAVLGISAFATWVGVEVLRSGRLMLSRCATFPRRMSAVS